MSIHWCGPGSKCEARQYGAPVRLYVIGLFGYSFFIGWGQIEHWRSSQ